MDDLSLTLLRLESAALNLLRYTKYSVLLVDLLLDRTRP